MRFLTLPAGRCDDSEMAVWGLWYTPDGRQLVAATGSAGCTYMLHWWDLARDRPAGDGLAFEIVGGDDPDVEDYTHWPDPAVCRAAGLYAVWGWDAAAGAAHLSVSRLRHKVRRAARTAPLPFESDSTHMTFTPDGRHLLLWPARAGPAGHAVVRWPLPPDLATAPPGRPRRLDMDPVWRLTGPAGEETGSVALSADGRTAAGGWVGGVGVWDFATGERVAVLLPATGRKQPAQVWPVAVSPDGAVVAGVMNETLHLWDVPGPAPRATAAVGPGVERLGFRPDGRRLIAVPRAGPVRVLDAADGRTLTAFDWQIGDQYALAFAPDGLTAAVGGTDGRVVVWDLDG